MSRPIATVTVCDTFAAISPSCHVMELELVAAGGGLLDLNESLGGRVSVSVLAVAASVPRLVTSAVNWTGASSVNGTAARSERTARAAAGIPTRTVKAERLFFVFAS